MRTLFDIEPLQAESIALTIGTFDGVHKGHLAILERTREHGRHAVCISFSNRPSQVLNPNSPVCLLTPSAHKQRLIEESKCIDTLILLPFTLEFAAQNAELFLHKLHAQIPFQTLVLGHDARIGQQRTGTPERIKAVAAGLGFEVDYLASLNINALPISSSRIREAIRQGELKQAAELLGRPISYLSTVNSGAGIGATIGYRTANIDVTGLCVPPHGVYIATLKIGDYRIAGVANLGVAPTLQEGRKPLLEVHLFEAPPDLRNQLVEVQLLSFLRPEQRFPSAEALRAQIALDVAQAKEYFSSLS